MPVDARTLQPHGVLQISLEVSAFRDQKQAIEFGAAYAFTETLAPGQLYNYRFDTREIKTPNQDTVTGCGWTYKRIAFGKV